ncbi:hypothetical protein [Methanoculleus sp.]|uniref:hypothetical protein n=1 Tax=Methanoculleus sp. TaxID=90427 RepID=UPI001BD28B53|nr:hypothetical protein [Methanoculleus sp.]
MNGEHTLEDHTEALEELGVRMIEQKAMDVAGQCAIYTSAKPGVSAAGDPATAMPLSAARQPVRVPANVSLLLVL